MWQKSGSANYMPYKEALTYIEQLFAGYNDWRLPTIPELMSLLEPEKQSNNLYINPIFDAKQTSCWSAAQESANSVWYVLFGLGIVNQCDLDYLYCVRAVRSWQ